MTEFPDRIPVSTYRIQLSPLFPMSAAARVCGYISRLGVTDLYCSPVLTASPGSSHGYDTCDHSRINPELGGAEAFEELAAGVRGCELGLILDFVPNHMGAHPMANRWWRDVLENGPSSPFARYFDIDWNPVKDELRGKLLLPILGDQYGVALDGGKLQLGHQEGMFRLHYYDHVLPLNPRQLRILLRYNVHQLQARLPSNDPDLTEFLSILFHLDHIPAYTESSAASIEERKREKDVAQNRLAALMKQSEEGGGMLSRMWSCLTGFLAKRLHTICYTHCWRHSRTGCHSGGQRCTRLTIAGFSTSTNWWGYGWRSPRFFKRRTGSSFN
jgi:(1->4)-alpha-D-glucan 1-alpha-D-glucosylmutase